MVIITLLVIGGFAAIAAMLNHEFKNQGGKTWL